MNCAPTIFVGFGHVLSALWPLLGSDAHQEFDLPLLPCHDVANEPAMLRSWTISTCGTAFSWMLMIATTATGALAASSPISDTFTRMEKCIAGSPCNPAHNKAWSNENSAAKKQPVKSKNTGKKTVKYGTRPRSSKPQQLPTPAARAATAGPGQSEPTPAMSPEMQLLRAAELELFGEGNDDSSSFSAQLAPNAGGPHVNASGLAPSQPVLLIDKQPDTPKLDYLAKLQMPDIPVKWTPRVVQYLEFYKNDPRGRSIATILYRKSGRYETMLKTVLRSHGLPQDLMWVSVVESGLRPTVYSPAGAAGLWQFMPGTGKLYGLVVDRWVDERLDPVRSSHAAAMFLSDLYKRFGTWELALASYNMGLGGLLVSIRKYNTNDFWDLCTYEAGIPWETTLYVPKIFALAVVMNNPEIFGLSSVTRDPPAEFDNVEVVPGVNLEAIAKAAKVDVSDVEALNPQFLAGRVPPQPPKAPSSGLWTVRLPRGNAAGFDDNLVQTRRTYPELAPYEVRQGESLATIAQSVGMTTAQLAQLNAMRTDEPVRPGSIVMLPPSALDADIASRNADEKPVVVVSVNLHPPAGFMRMFYQPVAGDTFEGVAKALAVSGDDLRRWNGLDPRARLHSGMSLMVMLPKQQKLDHVRVLSEENVQVLVLGSDAFYAHFEGMKGRVRRVMLVDSGQTWRSVSNQTGLSIGMLERINRRSRTTPLQSGERLIVYVPKDSALAKKLAPSDTNDTPLQLAKPLQDDSTSLDSQTTLAETEQSQEPKKEEEDAEGQPAQSETQ